MAEENTPEKPTYRIRIRFSWGGVAHLSRWEKVSLHLPFSLGSSLSNGTPPVWSHVLSMRFLFFWFRKGKVETRKNGCEMLDLMEWNTHIEYLPTFIIGFKPNVGKLFYKASGLCVVYHALVFQNPPNTL